jgi:hypothetical protein
MPRRHVHAAGERLDIQRLRVLPIDPVANAAKQREITQTLHIGRFRGHPVMMPPGGSTPLATSASGD